MQDEQMRVEVHRYWLNKMLCWHGSGERRVLDSSNGKEAYCRKCRLKHTAIYHWTD